MRRAVGKQNSQLRWSDGCKACEEVERYTIRTLQEIALQGTTVLKRISTGQQNVNGTYDYKDMVREDGGVEGQK